MKERKEAKEKAEKMKQIMADRVMQAKRAQEEASLEEGPRRLMDRFDMAKRKSEEQVPT